MIQVYKLRNDNEKESADSYSYEMEGPEYVGNKETGLLY